MSLFGAATTDSSQSDTLTVAKPRQRAVLNRIGGGRVLHVGCAGHDDYVEPTPSWFHQHLNRVADELIGIDTDRDAVNVLSARGYDVREDDAQKLTSVQEPVDYVVATEVIEHLEAPGALFEAARDVLAPGGRLLITTPNPWAAVYLRRVMSGGDPVGNDEHTCWIDESTLLELSRRAGFAGDIQHLPPMSGGLCSVLYSSGFERLGGTRLLGDFEPIGGGS